MVAMRHGRSCNPLHHHSATALHASDGAGDGGRTHIPRLEAWRSTVELRPLICTSIKIDRGYGGKSRDRTGDACLFKTALYQLSYLPSPKSAKLARMAGLEPASTILEIAAQPLSYIRSKFMVAVAGFEPAAVGL